MQVEYRSYPHPVLSYFSNDFINSLFQTIVKPSVTKTNYHFVVTSKTSCQGLLELVKNGVAVHATHVECRATRYRRLFKSDKEVSEFDIGAECLEGNVQLCNFIIAERDISAYQLNEFHPDFEKFSFRIRKGDILAVDRDRSFVAEKDHDPLQKLPSIFTITKSTKTMAPPIEVDMTGHKVVILLSEEIFSHYRELSIDRAKVTTLSSLIVIPALVHLLDTVFNDAQQRQSADDRRWFTVLNRKLKELGYDLAKGSEFPDSSLVIAQRLLGLPLANGLKQLLAADRLDGDTDDNTN